MNKNQALFAIILIALIAAVPLAQAATLSKPNVTLPSGWTLKDESAYPNAVSEHDSVGAGKVEYYNSVNNDDVKIYYENAPTTNYDAASLLAEAANLFQTELTDFRMEDSGSKQVAGVTAGYAYAYDSEYDAYVYDYVFVKDGVYYNVIAYYDANTSSESAVTSLMNSISMGGSGSVLGGSMLYIIIVVVIVIVVVVVVLAVVMSRKKKKAQQTQMQPQMAPDMNLPPPPPV
jgi:hypothetical protein